MKEIHKEEKLLLYTLINKIMKIENQDHHVHIVIIQNYFQKELNSIQNLLFLILKEKKNSQKGFLILYYSHRSIAVKKLNKKLVKFKLIKAF